jgi:hypothetical protein
MPEDEQLPEQAVAIYAPQRQGPRRGDLVPDLRRRPRRDRQDPRDESEELGRQDAMAAFVENVPLEGIYEVVEKIEP